MNIIEEKDKFKQQLLEQLAASEKKMVNFI